MKKRRTSPDERPAAPVDVTIAGNRRGLLIETVTAIVADATQMQRDLLVKASSKAQGQAFHYSRAVPAEEMLERLRLGIVIPNR